MIQSLISIDYHLIARENVDAGTGSFVSFNLDPISHYSLINLFIYLKLLWIFFFGHFFGKICGNLGIFSVECFL